MNVRCLVEGEATGKVSLLKKPLSFWGGFDPVTGKVSDRSHGAFAKTLTGRILAMPSGRGSSSASSILAEAIRLQTAPAAIILSAADPIITVGAIVALKLYGRTIPIVVVDEKEFERLEEGRSVRISSNANASFVELL